jgi:transposase-like protein
MGTKIAPSERKAQECAPWVEGQSATHSGEALWSARVRLSTERVLQEALAQEQTAALGRRRYERQAPPQGEQYEDEEGTVKTAAGVFRWQWPQVWGLRDPYRSQLWAALDRTSDVLSRLSVEMYAGGMSQRDIESALEKALGQCVVSKRAGSDITDRLTHAYEAFRARDLSGDDLASLCMDTVYEPLRRWGRKTGLLCVWGICVDGRQVLLSLSTAHSERYESCLEVWRDLVTRSLQTSVTIASDGAPA